MGFGGLESGSRAQAGAGQTRVAAAAGNRSPFGAKE